MLLQDHMEDVLYYDVSLAIREAGFKMRYDVKSALEHVPRLQPAVIFFTYR